MDMVYLVKNESGAENQVTESMYNYCKGKKEYQCRIVGAEPVEPLEPVETREPEQEWPKKDETGPWYTLSNGKRIKGKAKAMKAEAEI